MKDRQFRHLLFCIELLLTLCAAIRTIRGAFVYTASGGKHPSTQGDQEIEEKVLRIGLAYVRESFSRAVEDTPKRGEPGRKGGEPKGRTDTVSKARQKQNIEDAAQPYGFTIEWFVEEEGHRSGRDLSQRPQMQQMLKRMHEGGVRALIVNDLARLFRRGWRLGELLEELHKLNIILILAGSGRELDLGTFEGKTVALFMGIVDEWYAEDVRQRVLDYQERRRQSGLTIGPWPFGTIRQDGAALRPSPFGVWLLADGTLQSGQRDEAPLQPDALWRGYYDAARITLELYSQNAMGLNRIARELRHQGWFYRSSRGQPKLPQADDVRRVIAAWPQYAGLIVIGASKSRRRGDIPLDWPLTGREIFPVSLLRQVAWVEDERRHVGSTRAVGSKVNAYAYPLRGLVMCACCGKAKLSGTDKDGRRAYRHAQRSDCQTQVKSVSARDLENEVLRILGHLRFTAAVGNALAAAQVSWADAQAEVAHSAEIKRRMNLYQIPRQLNALNVKLEMGVITDHDYRQQRTALLRRQTEASRTTVMHPESDVDMEAYLQAIRAPLRLWERATHTKRQMLMTLLFESIRYDLDQRRITDYQLQPWARQVFTEFA